MKTAAAYIRVSTDDQAEYSPAAQLRLIRAWMWGASSLWSIGELFEQRRRVEKGWFPANPKRQGKYTLFVSTELTN